MQAGRLPGFLPNQMRLIFLLLMLIPLAPVFAQGQTVDLYSGTVPVADQSQGAREDAFPAALEQVLGKLSGLQNFEDRPEVGDAVQNARSIVLSFFYEQVAESTGQAGGPEQAAENNAPQTYLTVRFSEAGADQLMRNLGLPRWPQDRPPLDVWVLIDDGGGRRVLPLEYEFLRVALDRVADQRGLPLDWPKPGPDGEYAVDVQLLWGGYTEAVTFPGNTSNVLIIAARREGPEWSARFIQEYEGDHWTWRSRNVDLEQALATDMQQVVDQIVTAQAIAPSDQGLWVHEISISGMVSEGDYIRCLAYLQSLGVVDDVSIRGAAPDGVRMALFLNASPEYFEQTLEEGRTLEPGVVSGHYVLQR